ncbi:MAG TPA: FtsX-like permease family protein [Chryseolinea sp.]|nr:FtsX-like permease family protein [Chryseolinea sp.]
MIRNYILTALRHIRKSKINFAFKVGGLSLALLCFMAIAIYVSYQLSFDKFHDDYQRVFRVTSQRKDNGVTEKFAITPQAMGPLVAQLPAVAMATRVSLGSHTMLRSRDKVFDCEACAETDSSIFDVLSFEFIKGDKSALSSKNAMVITRSLALRMFGSTDVLQELVSVNGQSELFQVTAVVEDTRPNSHLYVEAMTRIRSDHELTRQSIADPVSFSDESSALYVKLHEPRTTAFQGQVEALLNQYVPRTVRQEFGFDVTLQPLADIYLSSDYRYDSASHGSAVYVYTFSTLGILLLLVAGINYVNLSIADYTSRGSETGVRRVLGARQSQLMLQATVEAVCFGFVSAFLAVVMLYVLFPRIAQSLDPNLSFEMLWNPYTVSMVAGGLLVLLSLSCWLPARQLNNVRITHSLKSAGSGYNSGLSRVLLFTQFAVSVLCLYGTLVVGQQIAFVHNKELGFDRKNLLVLSMPQEFSVRQLQVFKTELKQIPGVNNVSNSSFRIGGGYWKDWYFVEDGKQVKEVELYEVFSDDDLFATLKIPLLKGRTFNSHMPSDSGAAFVINETAARELGWDDPVGKRIYTHPEEKGKWEGTVVGVVADINISPLYHKVRPLVLRLPWQNEYPDAFIYVRYSGDPEDVAHEIEQRYKVAMPGYPLMLREVDELYNSAHRSEQKAFDSLKLGTLVIVFVAILGIFSMAAFMSAKRMKEFGIRKVLGASVQQIAGLNLQFFLRVALLANVLVLPVAYWIMAEWLTTFAYRTNITAVPFVAVSGISILLVIVAAGYSAWKSGTLNPVEVIKSE